MFRSLISKHFRICKQEKIWFSFIFFYFSQVKKLQRVFVLVIYKIDKYIKLHLVSELPVGILAIDIAISCEIWFKHFIQMCNNVILNLNIVYFETSLNFCNAFFFNMYLERNNNAYIAALQLHLFSKAK